MKTNLDMDNIARDLGAERRDTVRSGGGYFGAMNLVAEVQARFGASEKGEGPTVPEGTERRLVPLAPKTLKKLERLSAKMQTEDVAIEPLQLAGLLLEKVAEWITEEEAADLVRRRVGGSRR